MNYICGKCVFATEEEANQYRNWYIKRTKVVLGIFKTKREITHTFTLKEV